MQNSKVLPKSFIMVMYLGAFLTLSFIIAVLLHKVIGMSFGSAFAVCVLVLLGLVIYRFSFEF